ncbi:MAG TPA: hypothetical protein VF731_13355, partial [Solirubrobacterales bacterium]
MGLTIALALLLIAPAPAAAGLPVKSKVTLAWVPSGTSVSQLARAGLSPGLMSAGLGTVPAQQTYLDVGQGNRVFDSLYDEPLPPLSRDCPAWQEEVMRRADSAPAEIVPGLLQEELRGSDVMALYRGESSCALGGVPGIGFGPADQKYFEDLDLSLARVRALVRSLRHGEMLIAIARPTGRSGDPLPIGVAARGFDGNLISDSTRTAGYVLSTDVAPTILGWLGIPVPSQMSGQAIHTTGSVDAAAIESLGARMAVIGSRRGPVIGLAIGIWVAALALAVLLGRAGWAGPAARVVGLSVIYMPLVLLLGAALEAGEGVEQALVALGSPLLAVATLAALGGYRALAAASGITVLAYALDAIAGSPLTALSLLGPNPGLGVRFYGIGNELEAMLGVLIAGGTGAALAGFAPRLAPRRCAATFLVVGLACAVVFAAGRFGADVGAAIVFPVGAAVAAAVVAGWHWQRAWLVVAVPVGVLALLAAIDLATGANAHLTRSVLDAGGLGSLADVAQRRLQLSAHSFMRPILAAFL